MEKPSRRRRVVTANTGKFSLGDGRVWVVRRVRRIIKFHVSKCILRRLARAMTAQFVAGLISYACYGCLCIIKFSTVWISYKRCCIRYTGPEGGGHSPYRWRKTLEKFPLFISIFLTRYNLSFRSTDEPGLPCNQNGFRRSDIAVEPLFIILISTVFISCVCVFFFYGN